MIRNDDLGVFILKNFPHKATNEQLMTINRWSKFLLSRDNDDIFLLSGYAGTGKTSLISALVRTMQELKQPVILMAPTGRAAKVFASYSGTEAYTIHRRIYRQKSLDTDSFQVNVNLHKHTLFIVDEASMIANEGLTGGTFGTGRLLDDLIQYVYSGEGCRLLLVGDTAQLPPVGEEMSPAMIPHFLQGYGLHVHTSELKEVVRQEETSGILYNATLLRQMLANDETFSFPTLNVSQFPDIEVVTGNDLIEALEQSYYRVGVDETIVVTRSNKRANIFNQGIRGRILGYEEELCSSDRIIIAKNNYYWLEEELKAEKLAQQKKGNTTQPSLSGMGSKERPSFIANGDMALVRRVRNHRELYGFRFADATISLLDHNDQEVELTLLMDTLQAEAPALTHEQQEALFNAVWEDYPEITNKRDRIKRIKEDAYFNALQIKYAYAVTCHKAQGGQWAHVYVDQGYITEDMLSPDYFRWLYTALTRATEKVYLINWPAQQQC